MQTWQRYPFQAHGSDIFPRFGARRYSLLAKYKIWHPTAYLLAEREVWYPTALLWAEREVWYPTARICWQNSGLWYLFVARWPIWYPAFSKIGGLVSEKARCRFVTWGFLGPWVPNRRSWLETGNQTASFCQRQGRDGPVRYQTTSFCQRKGRSPRAAPNRSIREMLSGTLSDDATMAALALMGCAGRRASRRRRRRATEGNRGETPLLYQEP